MRRLSLTLALLLFATAAPAMTNCGATFLDVIPPRPTSADVVSIHVGGGCGDGCTPRNGRLSFDRGTVVVTYEAIGACILTPTAWAQRLELGRLAAGTHEIIVRFRTFQGEDVLARRTIEVAHEREPLSVRPRSGRAGTEVLVNEELLDYCPPGAACGPPVVTFGGVPAELRRSGRISSTVIAIAPPHAPGLVDVVATRPTGESFTLKNGFRYGSPEPLELTRILFPIALAGAGGYGAQWTTDNLIRNPFAIAVELADGTKLPANATTRLPTLDRDGGYVALVPRELAPQLSFSSHIRDLSRTADTQGSEITVVDERELAPGPLRILAVPLDPRFRATLRAYDIDGIDGRNITVAAYTGETVLARFLSLRTRIRCVTAPCLTGEPAWAVADLLQLFPELSGRTVDFEIGVYTPEDARIWSLISITNNETQQVTTYTPQRRR